MVIAEPNKFEHGPSRLMERKYVGKSNVMEGPLKCGCAIDACD